MHSAANGIHPASYVQSGDPGAVGAAVAWLDTTAAPPTLKKRNTGNTGWDFVTGPIFTTEFAALDLKATGMTGAATATRLVGANSAGAPASGTFVAGDIATDLSGKVWLCTTGGTPGTWTQIGSSSGLSLVQEQIASGSTASFTFNTGLSGYKELEIEVDGAGTNSSGSIGVYIQFNADTAGNYDWGYYERFASADGSSGAAEGAADTAIHAGLMAAATAPTHASGLLVARIQRASDTNFLKQVQTRSGHTYATGKVDWTTGHGTWRSTAALTAIKIFPATGSFVDQTKIALWGMN